METEITNEEYHQLNALGSTNIKRLLDNPFTWDKTIEQTPAMLFGSIAHCLVLEEPEKFCSIYYVYDHISGATKLGKLQAKQMKIFEALGFILVKQDLFDKANAIKTRLYQNLKFRIIMYLAKTEVGHYAFYKNVKLKCKSDIETDDLYWVDDNMIVNMMVEFDINREDLTEILETIKDTVFDLKFVDKAEPIEFMKKVSNFGYFIQSKLYSMITGKKFVFIAVEKEAPYMMGYYELDDPFLELAEVLIDNAITIKKNIDKFKVEPLYNLGNRKLEKPSYLDYKYFEDGIQERIEL